MSRWTCSYCFTFFFISRVGRRRILLNLARAMILNASIWNFKKVSKSSRLSALRTNQRRQNNVEIFTFRFLNEKKKIFKLVKINHSSPSMSNFEGFLIPLTSAVHAGRTATTCCKHDRGAALSVGLLVASIWERKKKNNAPPRYSGVLPLPSWKCSFSERARRRHWGAAEVKRTSCPDRCWADPLTAPTAVTLQGGWTWKSAEQSV